MRDGRGAGRGKGNRDEKGGLNDGGGGEGLKVECGRRNKLGLVRKLLRVLLMYML